MPPSIYVWLLGATSLLTILLAPLAYHPTRYYMPLYLVWDVLIVLWVPALARNYFPTRPAWLTERRLEWIAIGCIVLILTPIRLAMLITAGERTVIL